MNLFSKTATLTLAVVCLQAGLASQLAHSSQQTSHIPEAKTPEEHEAYVSFYNEADSGKKLELANILLARFPGTEFKPNVFLLMVQSLQGAKQYEKVINWAERFLNDFPDHGSKGFVLQALMNANQQVGNFPRTIEYAERLLLLEPQNLTAIYTIPFILSERAVSSEPEGRQRELARATELAGRGLSLKKPSSLAEGQWTEYRGALHSALGLIHLNNKNYVEAQSEYLQAISAEAKDAILYFRAGLAYSFDRKYDEALDLLAKSVFLKGITESQARTELERVYRIKHGVTVTGPELQAAIQKTIDEAAASLK